MRYLCVVMVIVFLWAPCASAAVKAQELELKAGTAALTVKTHDNKALAEAEIKLLGADDKVLDKVLCDKEGKSSLKDLKVGTYKLIIADRAQLPFTVSEKATVTSVLIVLPPPAKYAAGEAKKMAGVPTLVVFIVGAVAVAGAGVAAAAAAGGGGGGGGGQNEQHP